MGTAILIIVWILLFNLWIYWMEDFWFEWRVWYIVLTIAIIWSFIEVYIF